MALNSKLAEIKLVLADDHPLILKGLAEYLHECGFEHVETASNGQMAMDKIITLNPDLAILDIDMPLMTGLEVAQKSKELGIQTKFILLSYLKDPEFILQAKEANIYGYIIKEDALQELIRSIEHVIRGEWYFSQKLSQINTHEVSSVREAIKSLTPSEVKILKLIAEGMTSKTISDALNVSRRTVEKHRSNIISKLNIDGNSHTLTLWLLDNKSML
jgi:DNA-binding NarL/FixJ family response regulator